jgi:asparagine synthase (glutamine-hydrolysing)
LSGGYDSRLTLALLLEQGLRPRIHVYGRDDDPDVGVAKRIAEAEGFALEHVDKSRFPVIEPDAFPDLVERNFLAFHGHPADGIFENGSDLATRMERCSSGELMLNGGGGEIFRNFFYLSDRRLSVRQFLWTFYSRFDPRVSRFCTPAFDEDGYYRALGDKLRRTLGIDGDRLSRLVIERIFPEFRCRYWMGKNNSANNRLGPALTPFIDANVVTDALNLPLSLKNFGRFEGRLIGEINPALAGHETVYGHGLDRDPPWRRRLKDLATYIRPPLLRRFSYRLQHRRSVARPFWLSEEYLRRSMDASFPCMRRFVRPERVFDNDQYNRLCTLEYLFQKYNPAIADDD